MNTDPFLEITVKNNGEVIGWVWGGEFYDIREGDEGKGNQE